MKDKTSKIVQLNTWYSQDIAEYKKFADAKRNRYSYRQEHLTDIVNDAKEYISKRKSEGKPFTITGLQLALKMDSKQCSRLRSGDLDWRLYQLLDCEGVNEGEIFTEYDEILRADIDYVIINGVKLVAMTYSSVMDILYLHIQEQLEENCLKNGNPAGSIFLLKSIFGYSEKQSSTTQVLDITIADKQEALLAQEFFLKKR